MMMMMMAAMIMMDDGGWKMHKWVWIIRCRLITTDDHDENYSLDDDGHVEIRERTQHELSSWIGGAGRLFQVPWLGMPLIHLLLICFWLSRWLKKDTKCTEWTVWSRFFLLVLSCKVLATQYISVPSWGKGLTKPSRISGVGVVPYGWPDRSYLPNPKHSTIFSTAVTSTSAALLTKCSLVSIHFDHLIDFWLSGVVIRMSDVQAYLQLQTKILWKLPI